MIGSPLRPYFEIIWAERDWSWTVVGILYLFAGLFVRGWFMSAIAARASELDHKASHQVKSAYLRRAAGGWALFFLPLALIILHWRREVLPFRINGVWLLSLAILSFTLSILLHLQAFCLASLQILQKYCEASEKKLFE